MIGKKIKVLKGVKKVIEALQLKNKNLSHKMFKLNKRDHRCFYNHCNEVRYRINQMILILKNTQIKLVKKQKLEKIE